MLWTMPLPANIVLRNFGLALSLATVGVNAGQPFVLAAFPKMPPAFAKISRRSSFAAPAECRACPSGRRHHRPTGILASRRTSLSGHMMRQAIRESLPLRRSFLFA